MDILIDGENLAVEAGDFVLTDGITQIKQHITTALKTLSGEWVLDISKGIDYPSGLRDTNLLESSVRSQILGVQGVNSLDNFKMRFDKATLTISVLAEVKTEYGALNFNEILKI